MKLLKSFRYAARGVWCCIKCETNFRIHLVAALSVAIFAYVYGVSVTQGAALTLIIALIFTAELLNTAIEAVVDLVSPERNTLAALAKDCAAGAVMILAAGAVIIAVLIFSDTDKLMVCARFAVEKALYLAIYVAFCAYFIFAVPKQERCKADKE